MNQKQKTTDVYGDTRGGGVCRGCGAPLVWAEIVASGKRMPFNPPCVALTTRHDDGHRLIEAVDLADNHWATCPQRNQFKR